MTDYGLTSTGFNRKRLEEIKAGIEADITTLLGPMNLAADSVIGQIVGIFSKGLSDLWQEAENVYYSQYPATAEGTSLDNAVDLIAIVRLPATQTRVTVLATGSEAVAIPVNSIVKVTETGELFSNVEAGIITQANALRATVSVSTVTADVDYSVSINGTTYTYHSDPSPDPDGADIATGICAAINAGDEPVTATPTSAGFFTLASDDNDITFNLSVGSRITVTSRGSPVNFLAQNTGPVLALATTVNYIVTPVSGWASVTNLEDGVTGRNMETDQELRLRRIRSLKILGAASVEAIRARLEQDVQDVTAAYVFENKTNATVDGRPPHSFEAVVVGGDDQEIAQKIWEIKAAGIQTYGNVTEIITDSTGFEQEISFSRAEPVYVWLKAEITLLDDVTIPDSVLTDIAAAMLVKGADFSVGEDVIYQQFYSTIYSIAAAYIASVVITTATSATEEGPPGSYTAANVTVDEVEISSFALDRITVEVD